MALVTLSIGARDYEIGCRDGEEDHFRALAELVDAQARHAAQAMPGLTENRTLLFASLLLADQIAAQAKASAPLDPVFVDAVDALAGRIEALAAGLETDAPAS